MAGIPKQMSTVLSVFLPTRTILKRLLQKCTTPVRAMAKSIGKKMANTGARIVPSPKPEKKVRMAVAKAASVIIIISINFIEIFKILSLPQILSWYKCHDFSFSRQARIEKQAGVFGHGFFFGVPANRLGYSAFYDGGVHAHDFFDFFRQFLS
jgi:hypothetical protein